MVFDKIENNSLYTSLNKRFEEAFTFLTETDFSKIEFGIHEIDGENIFAIYQEYLPKQKSECKTEKHYKYIDIQFIVSGNERMGVTTRTNQTPIVVNPEQDCDLYDCELSLVDFKAGMIAIFFPDDIHMPGVRANNDSKVKKVVIKVKI